MGHHVVQLARDAQALLGDPALGLLLAGGLRLRARSSAAATVARWLRTATPETAASALHAVSPAAKASIRVDPPSATTTTTGERADTSAASTVVRSRLVVASV